MILGERRGEVHGSTGPVTHRHLGIAELDSVDTVEGHTEVPVPPTEVDVTTVGELRIWGTEEGTVLRVEAAVTIGIDILQVTYLCTLIGSKLAGRSYFRI